MMTQERQKLVGFFRELEHGLPQAQSIFSVVATSAQSDEEKIIAYLRNGTIRCLTMGPARDVISPAHEYISAPHMMTDGVWIWPRDLADYIEKYHVRIPATFIDHMRSNNWTAPKSDPSSLDAPVLDECDII